MRRRGGGHIGMQIEQALRGPRCGSELSGFKLCIDQSYACRATSIGDEICRVHAMQRCKIIRAGAIEHRLGFDIKTRAIRRQSFRRPLCEALLNRRHDAGVLDDLFLLIPHAGHDAVGVVEQHFLVDVGGLVPFAKALHAFGEREFLERDRAVAHVNLIQFPRLRGRELRTGGLGEK